MRQVFQLKTMLLFALLCAIGFGAQAQTANAINTTACNVIVRFFAVDAATCTIVAKDPGPYTIPTGGVPTPLAASWTPGPPTVPYIIVAEVAYSACGFPGTMVGSGGPCPYVPTAPMPPCPGCMPAGNVDNPGPIFPPGSAGANYLLNVHP